MSIGYFQCLSASAILYTTGYDALVLTENIIPAQLNLPQTCNIISRSAGKFLLLCLIFSQKEADSFITRAENPTCIHLERDIL